MSSFAHSPQDELCWVLSQHVSLWWSLWQPAHPETRLGPVPGAIPCRGQGMGHPHQGDSSLWAIHHRVPRRGGQWTGVQVRQTTSSCIVKDIFAGWWVCLELDAGVPKISYFVIFCCLFQIFHPLSPIVFQEPYDGAVLLPQWPVLSEPGQRHGDWQLPDGQWGTLYKPQLWTQLWDAEVVSVMAALAQFRLMSLWCLWVLTEAQIDEAFSSWVWAVAVTDGEWSQTWNKPVLFLHWRRRRGMLLFLCRNGDGDGVSVWNNRWVGFTILGYLDIVICIHQFEINSWTTEAENMAGKCCSFI